jgi:hypothetical protein
LDRIHNIDLDTVNLFPAFQNTLSSLSLLRVSLTLDAFAKLLGYFPNLRELILSGPTLCVEHRTIPLPSITPPRGRLSLSFFSPESMDTLLRGLCELAPEYDEPKIFEVSTPSISRIPSIVSACAKNLKRLKLHPCTLHMFNQHHGCYLTHYLDSTADSIHTLENLSELRELEFNEASTGPEIISLVSTIASTNIQKIAFNSYLTGGLSEEQLWSSFDTALSTLVDRLRTSGYQRVLELELRSDRDFAKEASSVDPDEFLPKFREKGRFTIFHALGNEILYYSDRFIGSGLDSEGSKGSKTTRGPSTPVVS